MKLGPNQNLRKQKKEIWCADLQTRFGCFSGSEEAGKILQEKTTSNQRKNLEKLLEHSRSERLGSCQRTLGRKSKVLFVRIWNESRGASLRLPTAIHFPDVDIVIYHPKTKKIIAVISSKVTLRERIAQTGYWKIKLGSQSLTKHIKLYLVTPDEDKTLMMKDPVKKGRAIVEVNEFSLR